MLEITQITCNHQIDPVGIDEDVQFSWILESTNRQVTQQSYRLQIARDHEFAELVYDSGMVNSETSVYIKPEGFVSESCKRYYVRVSVSDNWGEQSGWSSTAIFETALLDAALWSAECITAEHDQDAESSDGRILRSVFHLNDKPVSARAYVTALGLYELHLNGERVGDLLFTPGWTAYQSRLLYQTYDITDFLQPGENVIGALVGAGWYKGVMGLSKQRNNYGRTAALLCQIEIFCADGTRKTISSDTSWKWFRSAVVFSEIYDGEIYDARLEQEGWNAPGFDDSHWQEVAIKPLDKSILKAHDGAVVRKIERIPVSRIIITPSGETVLDFGQNLTGWVKCTAAGNPGDTVELRHAEILDTEGNFYTENLGTAKAMVRYILKGSSAGGSETAEVFEPHFTFQGFRYVKVCSFPGPVIPENFSAEVIHSDMEPTGSFRCSRPLVNQLQHNILWGMKGNFLDIPTDCPQRDERLGWTGDAQIFIGEAAFLMNTYPFFRKWLRDLAADQTPEGGVPHIIPDIMQERLFVDGQWADMHSSAAWGDAATIIPWTIYRMYGDPHILQEQYPSMKGWVEYIHARAVEGVLWNSGFHFGDWVALDAPEGYRIGATPTDLLATAYYAYSTQILAKTADVLKYKNDAEHYSELYASIKQAFQQTFLDDEGKPASRTQTACIVPLVFQLLPEESVEPTVSTLLKLIQKYDGHLSTGFVGTPYICFVLSQYGYHDAAYSLLLQEDYPSWLYQVKHGATTIWERWGSIKSDGTLWDSNMNSFNHYAYGAVGEWLYRVIAGIEIPETGAGGKHVIIQPAIGGGLSFAEAYYESVYGKIGVRWEKNDTTVELTVLIPHNASADIILTDVVHISDSDELNFIKDGRTYAARTGSGTYQITYLFDKY